MNKKKLTNAAVAVAAVSTLPFASMADAPQVTSASWTQDAASRKVTITYTLDTTPAVVTLDVQTNKTGAATAVDSDWVSIGGVAVANARGDVWKKVTTTSGTIEWHPDLSWPDHKVSNNAARAVVTAWALDNTPDFMVVDLANKGGAAATYYPGIDYLPGSAPGQEGAITNNPDYKATSLVMRKVMAKDVTWTMGSISVESQRIAARETPHKVTLTNNYYIGVFPVTQGQLDYVLTSQGVTYDYAYYYSNLVGKAERPAVYVSYDQLRHCVLKSATKATDDQIAANTWPKLPHGSSFLGLLRKHVNGSNSSSNVLDFDLPSESQWEFAAHAGNGSGYWGDGTPIRNQSPDSNLDNQGRYKGNNPAYSGGSNGRDTAPDNGGTPIVGSFAPNSWGIYDMCGTVKEWCLDWYQEDITSYNGGVNIGSTGLKAYDETDMTQADNNRVVRGGGFASDANICRPAYRDTGYKSDKRDNVIGFRVVCRAGLK